MNRRQPVVNIADQEETLQQLGKKLGTNKIRRVIFNAIYGRERKLRSKKQVMKAAGIPSSGTRAQQAQNQIEHLANHNLIIRTENDGSVKDGSRHLYGKDETVRAHRKAIVRYADDRHAADKVPTKQRPLITVRGLSPARPAARNARRTKKPLVVLYLAANPDKKNLLRLDAEVRRVQEALRGSKLRDKITVEYRPAADLKSLLNGLNDHRPQIVHFSGHGNRAGIATDDGSVVSARTKMLSFDMLAEAFGATDAPPRVVVLNSCESSGAGKSLAPLVDVVISMKRSVTDLAATNFATHFYDAIASGQSIKAATAQGVLAIKDATIGQFDIPELMSKTDPAKIILI